MRWAALLTFLSVPLGTYADDPAIRLATTPTRESVTLLLGKPPDALVQETRRVSLPQGESTLQLSWGGTRLVADSLRLSTEGQGVAIRPPVLLADRPQHAEWVLSAEQAAEADLTLSYLMGGLTWAPEYTVTLADEARKLSLDAVAVIVNDSGEDFEGAQVELGVGATVTVDLETGARLRLPYVAAPEAACELLYVYNVEAGGDTQERLDLTNDRDSGLGTAPLPAGKARIFRSSVAGQILTGEVRLPHIPVGATAKVVLGTAREVSVERRVIHSRQVNVKKDVHGRLALWNQEDEISLLVESLKDEDIPLRIIEKIPGQWKMLSNSHEFEQTDAEHIEFVVPVPAHDEVTVKYKVRRMNLLP